MDRLALDRMARSAKFSDPRTLEQMKVDTYNSDAGNLEDYDCPECRNKGNIAFLDGDRMCIRSCRCVKIRRCRRRIRESGLEAPIQRMTFEAFAADRPWQKEMKQAARRYAADPVGWLVFCGQSGSGKTHLCTAVCGELLRKGMAVEYMPWRDRIPKLKGLSMEPDLREAEMDRLKTAELLYLDDLFKTGSGVGCPERPTAADISLAFEVLDYRYKNRLPTLISTEMLPGELLAADEALTGRIREMAGERLYTIPRQPERNFRMGRIAP